MQIDCVTVKGSTQPMGLYTYDVTLERIATPQIRKSEEFAYESSGISAPGMDVETYSMCSYEQEFEEHPDLIKCAILN